MIHDPKNPSHIPEEGKGKVVFVPCIVPLSGRQKKDVLQRHFLYRKSQERTTAFIDVSGCGEVCAGESDSEVLQVLQTVRLRSDGKDSRNVSHHELREKLGYAPQQAVLFSGDIASNILYGNRMER
ncbi:MAG: hypothetical protein ACLR08_12480 [Dorea longicatena]